MANPPVTSVQNLLPVQAYFDVEGNFQTFIGQGQPFYATVDPDQSGLNITNSTINSTTIGATTPSTGVFTNIATTTGTISTAPVGATDIVNLLALQSYAAGISWKQPCVCATLSNITLSGLQTIDGHPVVAGNRVLVKNQGTASENGIYLASASNWTRSEDANTWSDLICAISFIEYGTQAGGAWFCTAQDGGTINVTANYWSQFTTSATYSAGTGLTLTGTVFSITNTGVSAATYGSATTSPAIAVNAQGQITSATNTTITPAVGSITGLGTGVATALAVNVGSSGSVLVNGGALGTPTSGDFSSGTFTWPIFNQNTTGTAAGLSATLAIASGGTGQTTASAAFNALSPITATGDLIIGNGANSATRLAIGSNNTVLTSNGSTASWVAGTSFMVYPGAGIPNSTGSAWGTSYSTTGSGTVVALATNPTLSNPNIDVIDFNTGYSTALTAGQLGWNGNNTLGLGMSGGNITQEIGLQSYIYGKASSAITKGQLIKKTGANGTSGVITFAPTTANMTNSGDIIGIAAESIALNGFGYIISVGNIKGFDTTGSSSGETWLDGDTLYYNPSGNGLMTKTKPSAPNLKTEVAVVINASSGGSGSVTVEIIHGSVLGGTDSNVQLTSPTGGQIISYDQTNQYWKNISLTAGTGISITPTTGGAITIANTVTAGITITDDTTTNATRYLTFTNATSGTITGENVSSTKLQFNPSTGTLTATALSGTLAGSNVSGNISGNAANVTGTVAIANGGTGQTTATAAFNALNPMTTTGDIIYEASPTTAARLGIGSTGQVLTVSGGIPAWATPSSGAVVQVKSTTKTDIFSSSSTSFVDITGFNVSITPTSSSNKVLVTATFTVGSDTATVFLGFRLLRGSTVIYVGDAAGSRTQASGGAGRVNDVSDTYSINFNFLDSPATTSSTTYKVQGINNNPNTWYVGSNGLNANNAATGRYPTTITVMEVTP